MKEHGSATHRRTITITVPRLATRLAQAWRAGVRVQELLLSGPWEGEGELRWRRELGRWRLVGSISPFTHPVRMRHPQSR